ncbi:gag-pol polyprotein [Tanacetum coccineum]
MGLSYAQEYGMDYEETFAPVAKMKTVRTLIAVASSRKWKIFQLDVKNAFLNGDLNEEVLMKPPPGVSHKLGEVCKLRKALYGLKQAPRAWLLGVYFVIIVDDMIVTGDDCAGIESQKLELAHRFAMKDLGLLRYFMDKMVKDIPIDAKAKYTPTDGDPLPDPSLYQTIVGSLVYLTVTRLDI